MGAQIEEPVRVETCAGGVVFKKDEKEDVRVALILDPYGRWAFPKGHVEPGETLIAAAVRETTEETGIEELTVVALLGSAEYRFRERYRRQFTGSLIQKTVHYFLMQAPADAVGRPQESEGIRKVVWMSPEEAFGGSRRYPSVRAFLSKAARHVPELAAMNAVQEES